MEADRPDGERDRDRGEQRSTWREANACHALVCGHGRRRARPTRAGLDERRLNIQMPAELVGGTYSNFANVSFSPYEFTLTFVRIEHEVEEGDVPGAVVARVNASPRFIARADRRRCRTRGRSTSTREGIRNLPEAPGHSDEPPEGA